MVYLVNKIWKDSHSDNLPIPAQYKEGIVVKLGGGFTNNRKGKYYRKIIKDVEYIRVYKKYNFMPKPKGKK